MNKYKFQLANGTVKEMEIDELARWACLLEGIEQVSERYDRLGMSMDTDEWVKPLAFQKYIEERFHSMKHDLIIETALGRI